MTKPIPRYLLWIALCLTTVPTAASEAVLKVALLPFFSSAPVFIADDEGLFKEQGIKIEYIQMSSAQNVAIAVATGEADVGVTGLTAGFLNLAGKGNLKILASQYQENKGWNGSSYLACNKAYENGLDSVEKLAGHRLGMTQAGSTFHRWYGALAQKLGIPMSQLELVSLQSVSGMVSALSGCHIDAMIALPQIADKLIREKKAHRIGLVSDYTPGQVGLVFASDAILNHKTKLINSFLTAYSRATHQYHQLLIEQKPPYPATSRHLLSRINRHLKPSMSETVLQASVLYIPADAMPDINDIQKTLAWFQEQKLVNPGVRLDAIIRLDNLRRIHP